MSLTCPVSGGSINKYYWSWTRQAAGKGLEWIGRVYSSGKTNHNPSFETRVSMSVDMSRNQLSLNLTSVTAGDTAVYYCARMGLGISDRDGYPRLNYFYYYGMDVWGPGTSVTVSSASPTSPKVFPLSVSRRSEER
ncbi:hypothetical protein, partial [Klebsiella pneumoniae]|uniref:hypothetical protein n=1 Tax=Klebsiella pneumoniae TaxID=573 RepID=UPI0034D2A1B1